ncbi:hemicentin-2-like isoform X5 [Neocloeon triangulifer]|uniref:hemicentin-2-like isoform X5 n=1 Tax=Neocloeon triangulifer TaxID=2078957 RepID=UPI00286F2464|nr:hemicentin-2-like isoform X5 [Neocloeon triangulifer]
MTFNKTRTARNGAQKNAIQREPRGIWRGAAGASGRSWRTSDGGGSAGDEGARAPPRPPPRSTAASLTAGSPSVAAANPRSLVALRPSTPSPPPHLSRRPCSRPAVCIMRGHLKDPGPRPAWTLLCVSLALAAALFAACVAQPEESHGNWDPDDPVSTVRIEAVLGRNAEMPCNIDPVTRDDRVYMVLWFKEAAGKPLYSFDVRGRPFNKAALWSDKNVFGNRAYFATVTKPAHLTLTKVQLDDEGAYRCRVDFKNSPTRNFQINLTVIVPPEELTIYDEKRNEVSGVIGPLMEGSDLQLACEVKGGKPVPTVSWFVNDKLQEGVVPLEEEQISPGVIINKLYIRDVRRHQLHNTFKCQASNTKMNQPKERTIRLDLFLKPLSVRLLEKPRTLQAGKPHSVVCEAKGSRPKADISWFKDSRKIPGGLEEGNDTITQNILEFIPQPEDHGRHFKCYAENPKIPGSGLEDNWLLNVVFAPQVSLQLGNTLNPDDIKEGDDVYFECHIRANPREHKITWMHNGVMLSQNVSWGIIMSTHSLVLQKVTRHNAGVYRCVAINSQGESQSSPVHLRVKFAPVCKAQEVIVVGGSFNEQLSIQCEVAADPGDVHFVWMFNNSGENNRVSEDRFHNRNTTSTLSYTIISERDYGTLQCWGTNPIGRQLEPCVFQVVPAGKPSPLRNCSLFNQTGDSLEVECVPGFDGGLPQKFILEVYEAPSMQLRLNLSSEIAPAFRVAELLPGASTLLRMVLYAANPKGRGEPTVLDNIALWDAERRTDSVPSDGADALSLLPLIALMIGALVTGLSVALLFAVALRKRRHSDGTIAQKSKAPSGEPQVMDINHDHYVVSYTLKSMPEQPEQRQPDILTARYGTGPNYL